MHEVIKDPDFRGIDAALRRAAKNAWELSLRTNTPFYVMRDGQVVDLNPNTCGKTIEEIKAERSQT